MAEQLATSMTYAEAKSRIPERETPVFWVGDLARLGHELDRVRRGKVRELTITPGDRSLWLVTYGKRESRELGDCSRLLIVPCVLQSDQRALPHQRNSYLHLRVLPRRAGREGVHRWTRRHPRYPARTLSKHDGARLEAELDVASSLSHGPSGTLSNHPQ